MKLIGDIIIRRLDVMKDLELNNDNIKAIWHFYQIYNICVNFLGIDYKSMNKKNLLIVKLIRNPDNVVLLNKIKCMMSKDIMVVETLLNSLSEAEEVEEVYHDYYPTNIFGVSIYDRGC